MKNEKIITKTIEGEAWQKALHKAYQKRIKEVKIEGFRNGTAPYDIYVKKMGVKSLYNYALDNVLDEAYQEALKEADVVLAVEPTIDIKAIDKDMVKIEFKFISKPEVTLGKYEKLGVKRTEAKATDEEINAEIKKLQDQMAEIIPKEKGAIEVGDTAVIDFEGVVDGKPLDGGKGENYSLEIGSHTFIPGFEEGLVGLKANETKELVLHFPEDYVEHLKGKEVTFSVTVKEIKQRRIPEVNEEFYKDLGFEDIKTEKEFRKEVENVILDRKKADIEDKFTEDVLSAASENLKVDINEEIIDDEVHRMIHQFEDQLRMQGLKMEDYAKITGITHEKMHETMRPEAIKRIKYRYLLEAIADQEKLDFTDKEVDAKAQEMADNYGISVDELIKAYGSKDVVKYDMRMHRALEILKEKN